MQLPVQITFRNMKPSAAVEDAVRERVAGLEKWFDRIVSCRVMIESPHRHHQKGRHFRVRIDLGVPGRELVVGREPAARAAHADFQVALRDAFKAARRALQDHARRMRGQVKTRLVPPRAGSEGPQASTVEAARGARRGAA